MSREHPTHRFPPLRLAAVAGLIAAGSALATLPAAAAPADLLARYVAEAGRPADAARGQQFFTSRHGGDWSCASCHRDAPTVDGRHAATGRTIAPLAPAANPKRFADEAKVEKWFRRNCKDVLQRECTPAEKADVSAWLLGLK